MFLIKRYSLSDHSLYLDKIQNVDVIESQKRYNLDNFAEQR